MQGHLDDVTVIDSRRFHIAMRRLADSFNYGIERSPYVGSGVDYMQSRPYQPGDSVRSIDWRVTARTGKVFVKEYEAPKRMPCYLMLDTSASMMIGATAISKYRAALQVAGGIALACLDRATPVGVIGVGETELRIEPSLSRDKIYQWIHRLRNFRYDEATTLRKQISELSTRLGNRALVVVLSDLHDEAALSAMRLMAQQHDCVALQFRDAAERGLPGAGLLLAREAETGHAFVTRGKRLWIDQENIDRQLKKSRIDHLVMDIDRPYAERLRSFFRARDVLGRGVR
jgi:uncharacterized protein (DUF58 family)